MKLYARLVLCYSAVSVLLTALLHQQGIDLLIETAAATYAFGSAVATVMLKLVPLILIIPFVMGWPRFRANLRGLGHAVVASIALLIGFSFLKSSIPLIVPFYADPPLADFDRWLHGGVDPWVIAHRVGAHLPMDWLLPVYLSVWTVPAFGLAVILVVVEHDRDRTARFLALNLFCWLILGNLLAVLGSSVGPVFYDALLGGDRFAVLRAALDSGGVTDSRTGLVQRQLWDAYLQGGKALGSGISAFPSVHVGIATLSALYLAERSRWLAVPGVAFLGVILFLSVYTGYHYAIDGYASIVLVLGAWAILRRVDLTALDLPWVRRGDAGLPSARQG